MPEAGPPLQVSSLVMPAPAGVGPYCSSRPSAAAQKFWNALCVGGEAPTVVPLTPERWEEFASIQHQVRAEIIYGPAQSWDPLAAIGDCKTYAARTALRLLDDGWPAGALRIATAFVNDGGPQQGASHAVVLVDTDKGTIVLDSRQSGPQPWEALDYIWLGAQAPGGHGRWNLLTTDVAQLRSALLANLTWGRRKQAT